MNHDEMMPTPAGARDRLDGLDVVRFLAFVGMVIVNFRVVVAPDASAPAWIVTFVSSLEGRAAALFVVLAGVGLGLAAERTGRAFTPVVLKRAAFLLIVGLVNSLVFPADILHFYAFYFLVGAACLGMRSRTLWVLVVAVIVLFPILLFVFDYDHGWDWETLTYEGFWTAGGFVRNLMFNGWHPVIPWSAFVLIGIALSRLRLDRTRTQFVMLVTGIAIAVVTEAASWALGQTSLADDPELRVAFLTTSVIPPTPLYMIASAATAVACIGGGLLITPALRKIGVLKVLATTGRQTLTLYIAHILLGMGLLEALGYLESGKLQVAMAAAVVFCIASVVYAWVWLIWFKRGPLEWLMRRV
jgi:uncharacterized membrane protein YeiB